MVLNTRVDAATEIEGFAEAEIPVALSLPANLAPARYAVRLEITTDEAETQHCAINNIHDKDVAYIDVVRAPERPLMAKTEVFFADDTNDRVSSGSIDVSKMSLFKLAVALRTSEGRSYDGVVTMTCEDVLTKEIISVPGFGDNVTIFSSFDVPLFSYWMRKSNLLFADGYTYRVMVKGQIDGDEVELRNLQTPPYFLKRQGDILTLYQDAATGIGAVAKDDASIVVDREGSLLTVSGIGLRAIKLYSVGGALLRQVATIDGTLASLSLSEMPQGVYLLRVEAAQQSRTYRILHTLAQ